MTREDMETLIDFYLRGADSKSAWECTDINLDSYEIEGFLDMAAGFVDEGIEKGSFDD